MTHKEVQKIAKDTMDFLRQKIHSRMSLREVRTLCENKMLELEMEEKLHAKRTTVFTSKVGIR